MSSNNSVEDTNLKPKGKTLKMTLRVSGKTPSVVKASDESATEPQPPSTRSTDEKSLRPDERENVGNTDALPRAESPRLVSSSQDDFSDNRNGSASHGVNEIMCCIDGCNNSGISGPYQRAPRGLSDKGFTLKKGIPRPVYFCSDHLSAITSKHKRKFSFPVSDSDNSHPNEANEKCDNSITPGAKEGDKTHKKSDGIKSRLRTRDSNSKTLDQLIAKKYLEDTKEPPRKRRRTDPNKVKKEDGENTLESETSGNEKHQESTTHKDGRHRKSVLAVVKTEEYDESKAQSKEPDDVVMKGEEGNNDTVTCGSEYVPKKEEEKENKTAKEEVAIPSPHIEEAKEKPTTETRETKEDAVHVNIKKEEEEEKEEKEKDENEEDEEWTEKAKRTETKKHKKEENIESATNTDDGTKQIEESNFVGMTCWRRGCNKPDRFLRLLLPFQVCTCKNHNEKVEGLLVKALATKRLQVGCERKRVPDKVCGICGNLLSGGEDSVACSQPSCSFAFCRSCVESLFLHDNMHGPIYDKRDSFNQIKKHEAKWKCWVCQTIERTEKTKGYREVYLEELIARLPEDVQKRILSLQYVAQTQATHSDLLPPPPPPQPKQQEETQPESPPTQPIAPIPSQQQQQQQPTSTSPPRQQQHHQQSPKQPQEQRKEQTLPQEPEKRSRRHYATRRETHEEAANEDSGFGIGSFRRLSSRQVKLKLRSEVTSGNGGSGGNNGSGGNGGSNGSSGNNGGGGSSGNNNGNGEGRRRDEDEELTPMRRLCEGLVEIACFWSDTAKKEEEKVMITHIFDTARDIYTRPNNGIDEEWMREEVEDAAEELQKSEAYLKMLVDRPKHSKSSETTVGRLRSLSRALAGHVHSVGVAAEGCAAFMKEMSAVSREQTKDAKAELRAAKTEYRVYCPKGDKSGESNSENSGEEEEEEDDDDDDEEEDEEREGTGKGTAAGGGKRKRGRHTKAIKNPLELQLEVLNKQLRKNRAEVAKREAEKKELERRLEKGPRVYAEDTEEAKKELEAMKSNAYAVGESKEQFRCLENFLRDYLELQRKYTEDLTRQCENKKRYAKIQERMEMGMPMGAPRLVAIYHPECLGHRVPADHLYQPCYLERAIEVVKRLGTQGLIDVQDSPNEAHHFFIGLVHKIKYVRTLVSAAPRDPSDPPVPLYQDVTGPAAPYLSPFSLKAATLSAGTVFEAVNQIATGNAQIAFCVTLPGSNRVGRDRTQGPGLLNDAAIGVEYAQKLIPITHSAIVDLDATQGCGTLEIFAGSKKVAAISVQAYTNSWDQETTATLAAVAAGDTGNTRNVWLPRGCSGEEWLHAIAKNVAEPLRTFKPYLLVFNMGFNGLRTDPEHLMNLTPEDYAAATRIVTEACPKARIISILGGCSAPLEDFTAAVEQHIHALTQRLVMPSHPLLQEPAHADMAATGGITAVTTAVKPETEEASKEPTKIVTTDVSIKTEPATNDGTKS